MRTLLGLFSLKSCFVGLALGCPLISYADPLLDFTLFRPPAAEQRKIVEPMVSWLVRPDVQTYCAQAQPKDGFHARPEGCVYWHRPSASCHIVTTNNTTHSQLGHLFVHCMQGQ